MRIIGEAAAKLLQLEPELVRKAPDIPWVQMRGLRNRLVHGYSSIDHEAVWDTVRHFLPQLKSSLNELEVKQSSAGPASAPREG